MTYSTCLRISNYKIAVHVTTPLKHGKIKFAKPFDPRKQWTFTVYHHRNPSKLINVTGIRNLNREWKIIQKIIKEYYQVTIKKMEINNIFATQNLVKHKLSYNLKAIQELGKKLYGEHFLFYLEPEISAGLHIKSRTKPTISFMCYGTGSACIFLTKLQQFYLVEKMLNQFYAESNLKQICS